MIKRSSYMANINFLLEQEAEPFLLSALISQHLNTCSHFIHLGPSKATFFQRHRIHAFTNRHCVISFYAFSTCQVLYLILEIQPREGRCLLFSAFPFRWAETEDKCVSNNVPDGWALRSRISWKKRTASSGVVVIIPDGARANVMWDFQRD